MSSKAQLDWKTRLNTNHTIVQSLLLLWNEKCSLNGSFEIISDVIQKHGHWFAETIASCSKTSFAQSVPWVAKKNSRLSYTLRKRFALAKVFTIGKTGTKVIHKANNKRGLRKLHLAMIKISNTPEEHWSEACIRRIIREYNFSHCCEAIWVTCFGHY